MTSHLEDNHLHLVAPPGSGKTVVGLEVMLRINKPTIIFVPTIALQMQWVNRLCTLFLQIENVPDWISFDINNPKFLTVSTYQAIHSAFVNRKFDTIKRFQNKKIGTIIFDEAHHLKKEWYNTLFELKLELNTTIVGLTATPPYDVDIKEWKNYEKLNGKIDTIISVPELVEEGDLCPHQDYVYFSLPTENENNQIEISKEKIHKTYNDLIEDLNFILAIENHPYFHNTKEYLDSIYYNLEAYTSILIFLKHIGLKITKEHLKVFGQKNIKLPKLNYEWMGILLTFYLFKDKTNFIDYEENQEKIINKLKRIGVVEYSKVNFYKNKKVNKSLTSSISKLESIGEIVDFEYTQLKTNLRMVILSDYIRKEFLEYNSNNKDLKKLGVIPIFEFLRRKENRELKLGVLTGSLVIIPASSLVEFQKLMAKKDITNVSFKELSYDENYLIIRVSDKYRHYIVSVVTELFQNGNIQVLVGTKALLGEGWDAPAINTLILASFVGSYVLSNQMRGRAIRTQQNNKNKTGNIWHLVCVDINSSYGGIDVDLLERRFKAFTGINFSKDNTIENGIQRLQLGTLEKDNIELENNRIFAKAVDRNELKAKWEKSVQNGTLLQEEYKIPFSIEEEIDDDFDYEKSKTIYFNKTIKNTVVAFAIAATTFSYESVLIEFIQHFNKIPFITYGINVFGAIGIAQFGYKAYKTFSIYTKYRDISKDIQNIGEALLATLFHMQIIKFDKTIEVKTTIDKKGTVFCYLENCSNFEKTIFLNALEEILSPIDNPKYIMVRINSLKGLFIQKDFHAVPEIIGKKKHNAEFFKKQWKEKVGLCMLVYTRMPEGREFLFKARKNSLSAKLSNKKQIKGERIYRWQ